MQHNSILKNLYLLIQLGLALSLLSAQTQVGSDIDGEAANDRSGWSVSMDSDGSHVAIGARYNDAGIPGSNLGHVRVYEYSSGSWSQVGSDIDGEANTDYSGYSVSLDSDGSHVVIGAPENDGAGGYNSGHARIYEYSDGSWSQLGSDIDGDAVGDNMGISVSIDSDGSHVAIGAIYKDGNGTDAGHVRIFEYDGSDWSQVGSDIHGETEGDQSGISVSIDSDGSHVAIAAKNNDDGGGNSGHVRIFEYDGSAWIQVGSDIDGDAAGDYSGGSISIDSDGSHVAIGAENKNSNTGQVRVFEYSGATWSQLGSDIDGVAAGDYFGTSVSIDSDGSHIVVGGKGNDDGGGNSGHVKLYGYSGSSWVQIGNDVYGESASDYSGFSVSIDSDGSHLAISAPYNIGSGSTAGHVRVFTFDIPGITVSISDSITSEAGDTASFTVVLDSEPTADVVIPISSSDVTEGIALPDTLTFTAANWSTPQTVTVTGVNDDVDDGDIAYTIVLSAAASSDGNYNGVDADDVSMTNTDDDSPGITVSVSDSITSEAGDTASFTVVLDSEPTSAVVIPISSSDVTEGIALPDTLTFTAANWSVVQTVTVTGVDDNELDGDIAYSIEITTNSADTLYNGVSVNDIQLTNLDYEPIISVLATILDFDTVVVLSDSTLTITVGNTGNENLVIDSVTMSSSIFSIESFSYPLTITPAEDSVFTITFTPLDTIQYTGKLVVFSNDPDSSAFQVSLSGNGYNSAPVIVEVEDPDSVSIGDSVTVNITVSDDDSISAVVLNYFIGGDNSMYSVTADDPDGDGTFSADIDSSAIGITGVAYYIEATDNFGNTSISDTISIITQFDQNVLNTAINGSAYADGIPNSKWRLISVPTNLDNSSVSSTIQDEFNQPASEDTWRLYKDSGSANWEEAESFILGQGYWILQRMETEIDFSTGSGHSVDLLGFSINLPVGWSLIGNPYPFALEISFDDAQVYGPLTYGSSGIESWDAESNILSPWQGYAIYNRTTGGVTLDIKPLESIEGNGLRDIDYVDGWQIIFNVNNGEYGDIYNAIGRSTVASDQLDIWDNPEPPTLDKYISLNMDRSEWGGKTMLTSDIRSLDNTNGIWEMNLDIGKVEGPFKITTERLGSLPEGQIAILLDHIERKSYDLSSGQDIFVANASDQFSYPMTVIVGDPVFVSSTIAGVMALIPQDYALYQNHPNPFNPLTNISFSLPKPSIVEIKIYNILGQSVVTLTSDWYDLGHHSLQWDGRDIWGKHVGTGIYFYSMETADFRQVQKLMLLK